jgi:predicted HicB family RNase H-like nuclease
MTDKQLFTAWVDPAFHKAVKVKAAQEGISVSEIIRRSLQGWLLGQPTPKA